MRTNIFLIALSDMLIVLVLRFVHSYLGLRK